MAANSSSGPAAALNAREPNALLVQGTEWVVVSVDWVYYFCYKGWADGLADGLDTVLCGQ